MVIFIFLLQALHNYNMHVLYIYSCNKIDYFVFESRDNKYI